MIQKYSVIAKDLLPRPSSLPPFREVGVYLISDHEQEMKEKDEYISQLKFERDSIHEHTLDLEEQIAALKAENDKIKKRWEYKAVMDADEELSRLKAELAKANKALKGWTNVPHSNLTLKETT